MLWALQASSPSHKSGASSTKWVEQIVKQVLSKKRELNGQGCKSKGTDVHEQETGGAVRLNKTNLSSKFGKSSGNSSSFASKSVPKIEWNMGIARCTCIAKIIRVDRGSKGMWCVVFMFPKGM